MLGDCFLFPMDIPALDKMPEVTVTYTNNGMLPSNKPNLELDVDGYRFTFSVVFSNDPFAATDTVTRSPNNIRFKYEYDGNSEYSRANP